MSKFVTALDRADEERRFEDRPEASPTSPEGTHTAPPASLEPTTTPWTVERDTTPAAPGTANGTDHADVVPSPFRTPPAERAAGPAKKARRRASRSERPTTASDRLAAHLVSLLAPASFEAEQYRVLRHRVEQFHKSAGVSVIGVSSPTVADGKTTTAINLAGALAQGPQARVLLIDCDLRRPSIADNLALDDREAPGLVDAILEERLGLEDVVRVDTPLNLSILPAGRRPAAPYEVLQSPRMEELLALARTRYDYIVVDTPPLVSVPDCRVIGKWVDGFLIVVAAHRTSRKSLEEAMNVPEPGKILGLVFNGDDHHFSMDYYTQPANGNGAIWQRRNF